MSERTSLPIISSRKRSGTMIDQASSSSYTKLAPHGELDIRDSAKQQSHERQASAKSKHRGGSTDETTGDDTNSNHSDARNKPSMSPGDPVQHSTEKTNAKRPDVDVRAFNVKQILVHPSRQRLTLDPIHEYEL